jgi:hypothetical protein
VLERVRVCFAEHGTDETIGGRTDTGRNTLPGHIASMHPVKVRLSSLPLADLLELAEREGLIYDTVMGTAQVSFRFTALDRRRHCLALQRAALLLRGTLRAHYTAISAPPPPWLDPRNGDRIRRLCP